jgi:hypothetical protein
MLNYMQVGPIGDASFLVFVASWIYTRHYILFRIIFSIYKYVPQDIEFIWDPSSGRLASHSLWLAFLGLLIALEAILMIWLFMIFKVLWKVIRGHSPEDTRSDSESVYSSRFDLRDIQTKNYLISNRDTGDEEVGERKENYAKIRASEKEPLLKALKTTGRSHQASTRAQQQQK